MYAYIVTDQEIDHTYIFYSSRAEGRPLYFRGYAEIIHLVQ